MSREVENVMDPFKYAASDGRVAEEVNKIEEYCMKFLKDGETKVKKLLDITMLENHAELPNKE